MKVSKFDYCIFDLENNNNYNKNNDNNTQSSIACITCMSRHGLQKPDQVVELFH